MKTPQIHILRTDTSNPDYQSLIPLLDAELTVRDGGEEAHAFYRQYNKSDEIRHVVVAYVDHVPAGCGAIKAYDSQAVEVKRMFVPPELRGKGIAGSVLRELEKWAEELGFETIILETGIAMPEAIGLYRKSGYGIIPNYGQYAGKELSVCMKKSIVRHQ
jgi:putative acetyltransferase